MPDNKNGRHLLDWCIGSSLRILNGRVLGDSLGYHRCFPHSGNPSTIDHFLASSSLLDNINKYLNIEDPSVHSKHSFMKLSFSANFSLNPLKENKYRPMEKVRNYKWDSNIANRFKMAVIRNLKASDILTTNIMDINQSSALVDNLATNLNDFFYQCASDANMKVKCASGRRN